MNEPESPHDQRCPSCALRKYGTKLEDAYGNDRELQLQAAEYEARAAAADLEREMSALLPPAPLGPPAPTPPEARTAPSSRSGERCRRCGSALATMQWSPMCHPSGSRTTCSSCLPTRRSSIGAPWRTLRLTTTVFAGWTCGVCRLLDLCGDVQTLCCTKGGASNAKCAAPAAAVSPVPSAKTTPPTVRVYGF